MTLGSIWRDVREGWNVVAMVVGQCVLWGLLLGAFVAAAFGD